MQSGCIRYGSEREILSENREYIEKTGEMEVQVWNGKRGGQAICCIRCRP